MAIASQQIASSQAPMGMVNMLTIVKSIPRPE